jgi:formate dehydrogenase maturation protein FdhE
LGPTFQAVWSFLQPLQYVLCELIWCVCLWKAVRIETVVCENVPQSLTPFSSFEINLRRLRAYLVQGSSGLQ